MIFKTIIRFLKAIFRHANNKFKHVPSEVWAERFEKCISCVYATESIPEVCTKCNCVIYKKTEWASEECPIGKWKRYEG